MSHEQTSKVKEIGYTKAVDLWSLGCVTVVLLTGGYPFFEAGSGEYSERLASDCNLDVLEKSQSWRDVGARPKAFVKGLLVLDERQRMTAKESLTHEWFTNDAYRTDFEELYRRAIRHWRPRTSKNPIIELVEADNLKCLPFSQPLKTESQKSRKRGPIPFDPPCKSFPRRLHNQAFFPKRKPSPFNNAVSDEVKAAIERNWNFDKSYSSESSVAEEELPTPRSVGLDRGGDDQPTNKLRDERLVPTTIPLPVIISKKPRFQPLRPKNSLTKSYGAGNQSESCSTKLKSRGAVSSTVDSAEKDMTPARKMYSPPGWEKEAHALTSVPNSKAKLTLPTRPMTPRPPKTLSDSNVGLGLSPSTRYSMMTQQSGRYFAGHSSGASTRKPEERVVCVDQQSHPSGRHNFGPAIDSPSRYAKRRANQPLQSFSEATSDKRVLNSELEERADSTQSILNAPRASSYHINAHVRAVRPEAVPIGLRLDPPTRGIGKTLGSRSSDTRKRRSNSIFDFEQDPAPGAPAQSKKARLDQENVNQHGKRISINATFALTKAMFGDKGCTNMQVEKMLGGPSRNDNLYLPRV
jgi:serine/threonine protein kinase